jgi:hypothetical protein
MAGLCYVMPITGHKAYTGKEEEETFSKIKIYIILCYYSCDKQNLAAFVHQWGHLSGCEVFISSELYGNPQNMMDTYIIQSHTLHN